MLTITTTRRGNRWVARVHRGTVEVCQTAGDTAEEAERLARDWLRQVRLMVRIIDELPE